MKFLKRKQKEEFDLDLPPEPPPLEDFEKDLQLPEFPEFEEKISAPEQGFELQKEEEFPDLGKESELPELPEFPEFPGPEETAQLPHVVPPVPKPEQPAPEPKPEPVQEAEPVEEPYPRIARKLFGHERAVRERPAGKTIFVKVDNFKAMLGTINIVRSDLKKSEDALAKLEAIKGSKDISFEKLKASLDDLQRKLIFMDKTLFKGE